MASKENINFLRSFLLLIEGGLYISKKILSRLCLKPGNDLDELLKINERKLKHLFHDKQYKKLYPEFGKADINTWDLQLSVGVLLNVFGRDLEAGDKLMLKLLRDLRNDIYMHCTTAALDEEKYEEVIDDLDDIITTLASSFDTSVRQRCSKCIKQFTSGPLDAVRPSLKTLNGFSQLCQKKIKVGVETELVIGGPSSTWISLCEDTLEKIFNHAESMASEDGGFQEIEENVKKMLSYLECNKAAVFKECKRKCIILYFECNDYESFLHFLSRVERQEYTSYLCGLSNSLHSFFKPTYPIFITSQVSSESLQSVLIEIMKTLSNEEKERRHVVIVSSQDNMPESKAMATASHVVNKGKQLINQSETSLFLNIELQAEEALPQMIQSFLGKKFSDSLTKVAGSLSRHYSSEITLRASMDVGAILEALEESVFSEVTVANWTKPPESIHTMASKNDLHSLSVSSEVTVANWTKPPESIPTMASKNDLHSLSDEEKNFLAEKVRIMKSVQVLREQNILHNMMRVLFTKELLIHHWKHFGITRKRNDDIFISMVLTGSIKWLKCFKQYLQDRHGIIQRMIDSESVTSKDITVLSELEGSKTEKCLRPNGGISLIKFTSQQRDLLLQELENANDIAASLLSMLMISGKEFLKISQQPTREESITVLLGILEKCSEKHLVDFCSALEKNGYNVSDQFMRIRQIEQPLPWNHGLRFYVPHDEYSEYTGRNEFYGGSGESIAQDTVMSFPSDKVRIMKSVWTLRTYGATILEEMMNVLSSNGLLTHPHWEHFGITRTCKRNVDIFISMVLTRPKQLLIGFKQYLQDRDYGIILRMIDSESVTSKDIIVLSKLEGSMTGNCSRPNGGKPLVKFTSQQRGLLLQELENANDIAASLLSMMMISGQDFWEISHQPTRGKSISILLDILEKCSEKHLVEFCSALRENGYKHVPEELTRKRQEEQYLRWKNEEGDDIDILQSVSEEFGHNPLHIDLYQRALSRGFETDNTVRVNVVGNFAQGKTSLTQSLVGKTCQSVESTNGVEINHCKYYEANGNVQLFQKTTPDDMDIINRIAEVAKGEEENVADETNITEPTANTERYLDLQEPTSWSVSEDIIDSASQILYSRTQAKGKDNTRKHAKSFLTPEEVQKFSTLLTSKQSVRSVDGNLEIWDFAGQFVFYASHTIFHSNRAVYLLVFDLSKPLSTVVLDTEYPMETGDKTMEQVILFWMNSIHSYVGSKDGSNPPVILVGTHKDKLLGTEKEKIQYAEEYFEKIRTLFENTKILKHFHTKDFVVNSTDPDDKGIEELRKEIIHIREHSKLKVPARWIALEKELVQIRYKKIIPFSKVVEIDSENDFPLKEEEQIKLFLLYHHMKGTLFFFDEEPISRYVVLDTQFLVDAFRCIVTSERFCRKEPQYRSLWKLLQKEAKLTMELIEISFDSNSELSKFKNEILMFMQRHYIISEVSSFDGITGKSYPLGWYIVPIFLRNHSDNKTLKEFLTGKKQTALRFLMAFQYSPVVQIVYCRLIAAMVARWPVVQIGVSKRRKEFLLYENLGVFRLDSRNAGVVELQQNTIDMRVISLYTSRNINNITADKFRRFAESVVISEFNKVRHSSTLQGKPFQTCFSCNNESHDLNGSQEILQLESLKGTSIAPCLDEPISHEIHTQQALSEWFAEISTIGLTKDCQINEKQLSKIAQSIGYNWELLGSELGLSIVEINRISMDNNTSSMRIYKMLLKWKAEQQENATVNTLLHAMKSTKSLTVEWDEVMNIVEQIASTQTK